MTSGRFLMHLAVMLFLMRDVSTTTSRPVVRQSSSHEDGSSGQEETSADSPPVAAESPPTPDVTNSGLVDMSTVTCRLSPTQKFTAEKVADVMKWNCKLIEFTFTVQGYDDNPLEANNTVNYKTHAWSRVVTGQGQTILNLAFNYGILSLMTLTFGVEAMAVELAESEPGCIGRLSEDEKVKSVLDIVLRDMDKTANYSVIEDQGSVCHQIIRRDNGVGTFTDKCYYRRMDNTGVVSYQDIPNKWLGTLDILLTVLMCTIFIFGPVFVPDWIYSDSMRNVKYQVILKEPLYKKIVVVRQDALDDNTPETVTGVKATHTVDLRNKRDFTKCRKLLSELPENKVIPIVIERFHITVNYRRLLQESKVPVGMTQSISRSIFLCKLRSLEPFEECCRARICGGYECCKRFAMPWISCCKLMGRVLLVLLMPLPFYVRLTLYYIFEHPEMMDRQEATAALGVRQSYNYRLMQYLTPTHPVFIAAYIIYFVVGLGSAVYGGPEKDTRFHRAIVQAFGDLKDMTWLHALSILVKNMLWPFKAHGLFVGCCIGLLIWPVFVPVSTVVCFVYCLPIVFLTCRILYHLFIDSDVDMRDLVDRREDIEEPLFLKSVKKFETEEVIRRLGNPSKLRKQTRESCYCGEDTRKTLVNVMMSVVILATMYSAMLMVAEVAGSLAEVACFTMMGLIVNASKVLRYGSLIFLVLIYSYDTYNNVNKKYLKLNKALFTEIQRRIKDLEEYTSLPSNLQENRGFKSCENSEQADYENEDDVVIGKDLYWDINDLILLVDRDDTPRIPRKLFEQVCDVQVAGSPGPVYKSLLQATGKFFIIIMFLLFVFIVVMSFGDSYKISTTNQTLATLAGGFLPFIFTNLLKPSVPQVETGLVSFKSKLEEIIKNFHQTWPMYDFTFAIGERPPESDEDGDSEAETVSDNTSGVVNGEDAGATNNIQMNQLSKPTGEKKQKKEKEKEKKQKKDDKDTKGKNGKQKPKPIPRVVSHEELLDVKNKIEDMELDDVTPGREVDALIIMSERDNVWLMSSSMDTVMMRDCVITMEETDNSAFYPKKDYKV